MGQPHKHAEVIKAWADGAEIQVNLLGSWEDIGNNILGGMVLLTV